MSKSQLQTQKHRILGQIKKKSKFSVIDEDCFQRAIFAKRLNGHLGLFLRINSATMSDLDKEYFISLKQDFEAQNLSSELEEMKGAFSIENWYEAEILDLNRIQNQLNFNSKSEILSKKIQDLPGESVQISDQILPSKRPLAKIDFKSTDGEFEIQNLFFGPIENSMILSGHSFNGMFYLGMTGRGSL